MPDLTMTIDGRCVSGFATFGVINPASGKVFASAPDCTREELDAAMESSARAFSAWRSDEAKRRKALRACAEVLQARASELAPLITREQGKPLAKATEEIAGAAVWFAQTASLEIPVEVLTESGDSRIEVRRRPLGVVADI